MIKILELFGGIGACTQAFKKLDIPIEIADYVEIDKYAVKSYNAINGTNFEPQDITKWDKDIEVDFIMHGSPCQDFSIAGKNAGGDENSGTRSSLMYETLRIVKKLKPKYILWENVKNVISKKHIHNFNKYLQILKLEGYNNYYQVLNAKDYGIPQNRERVFTISIRKDIDNGSFLFPDKKELVLKLKDILEEVVDKKYFLTDKMLNCFLSDGTGKYPRRERFLENMNRKNSDIGNSVTTKAGTRPTDNYIKVKNATKQGYDVATDGDTINLNYPNSKTRRGRVGHQVSQTIMTNDNIVVVEQIQLTNNDKRLKQLVDNTKFEIGKPLNLDTYNQSTSEISQTLTEPNHNTQRLFDGLRIRKLTPKECWRLMGFSDENFDKAKAAGISDTQLYKQAGNSIVVNVLENILKNLFESGVKNE